MRPSPFSDSPCLSLCSRESETLNLTHTLTIDVLKACSVYSPRDYLPRTDLPYAGPCAGKMKRKTQMSCSGNSRSGPRKHVETIWGTAREGESRDRRLACRGVSVVAARTERRRKAPRRKGRLHEAVPGWGRGGSPSRTACFLDITVGYFWWFRSGDTRWRQVAGGGTKTKGMGSLGNGPGRRSKLDFHAEGTGAPWRSSKHGRDRKPVARG